MVGHVLEYGVEGYGLLAGQLEMISLCDAQLRVIYLRALCDDYSPEYLTVVGRSDSDG